MNLPEDGKCTLARVTKPYYFEFDEKLRDLSHRFGVDPETVRTFDRNESSVHPHLSARLKLQGSKWQIYARKEFADLLEVLSNRSDQDTGVPSARTDNLARLCEEIRDELSAITRKIQHTHPNRDLEAFVQRLFESMPGVLAVERKAGGTDEGADLVVAYATGLPIEPFQGQGPCLKQVKSYQGKLGDTGAINDLRRAFAAYPDATMGVIVSTADETTPEFDNAFNKLQEELGERITLHCLYGPRLAALAMRILDVARALERVSRPGRRALRGARVRWRAARAVAAVRPTVGPAQVGRVRARGTVRSVGRGRPPSSRRHGPATTVAGTRCDHRDPLSATPFPLSYPASAASNTDPKPARQE